MSSNGTFSIQKFDKLKESGFNEQQARGLLEIISEDSISKADLQVSTTGLKRDIKELDAKIETVRAELKRDIEIVRSDLKRDIKELDTKIETAKIELKRDIKELSMKMIITGGGFAFAMLTALVTLAKLGLLSPPTT